MLPRIAAGALLLGISACARLGPPSIAGHEIEPSARPGIIEAASRRETALRSFKGLYRALVERRGERAIMRYLIVFEKPRRIRIEVLPVTGAYTVSLLISDGERIALLDTVQKRAFLGDEGSKFVRSAISIPVEPGDLTAYLTGAIPAAALSGQSRIYLSADNTTVSIVSKDYRSVWTIDGGSGALKSFETRHKGGEADSIVYEYAEQPTGETLPSKITVRVPGEGLTMELVAKGQSTNVPVSQNSFAIAIPDGYQVTSGLTRLPGEF